MTFEIGKTYNGYEILDVLKMSKTQVDYRVRNLQERRLEVLTVLPGNLQGDQERMERFLREMKVHARLNHPNIVGFYSAMELERQAVMTTELVEGVTLRERLEAGPLGCTEAVAYFRQVLAALACAHGQKIVHRDITPASIVITPEGVVKLSGFGLAKSPNSPQLTQLGAVVGSLKYISPEQIKGSGALDPRGDLYSVGVVLYEAITGKTPFESASQFELMLAHVSQIPKAPSALRTGIPEAMDRVVLKALAKDPAERYQTAQEFSAALDGMQAVASVPAPAVSEPAAVAAGATEPAPPPVKSEPAIEPAPAPAPVVAMPTAEQPVAGAPAVEQTVVATPSAEPVNLAVPATAQVAVAAPAPEPVIVAAPEAEPVVTAPVSAQAVVAAPTPEPVVVAAPLAEKAAANPPAPEAATIIAPAVEQAIVAAPAPEQVIAAAPAAELAVPAAPTPQQAPSAPPAMFQTVASDRLESASLMAIGLGAAGVTAAVVLAYVFLGK